MRSLFQSLVSSCASPDIVERGTDPDYKIHKRNQRKLSRGEDERTTSTHTGSGGGECNHDSANDNKYIFINPAKCSSVLQFAISQALKPCGDEGCGVYDGEARRQYSNREKHNYKQTMFRAAVPMKNGRDRPVAVPLNSLVVADIRDLESVSELTMRSHSAMYYNHATVGEDRRMAYYAISNGRTSGTQHGNRRCYFSGRVIRSSLPFYAGSVQQGLKTLVVFCLPESIGIRIKKNNDELTITEEHDFGKQSSELLNDAQKSDSSKKNRSWQSNSHGSGNSSNTSVENSTFFSESIYDLQGIDPHQLYNSLPQCSDAMLNEMKNLYREKYETLPAQVRTSHCWRLYMKFCFFSGLPIGEDEEHYRIKDDFNDYGEDINLSHDVLVVANGEASAALIRKPNTTTFRYIQKHYSQQCSKLHKNMFDRRCWESVLAEV